MCGLTALKIGEWEMGFWKAGAIAKSKAMMLWTFILFGVFGFSFMEAVVLLFSLNVLKWWEIFLGLEKSFSVIIFI